MLLIVCEILFFFCNTMRCLQPHYRLSTAYYRLSTDSLQTLYRLSTDSLQTLYSLLWTLYRLSTLYYGSLQTLYSLYRLSTDSLQPHCSGAAAVLL